MFRLHDMRSLICVCSAWKYVEILYIYNIYIYIFLTRSFACSHVTHVCVFVCFYAVAALANASRTYEQELVKLNAFIMELC